MALLGEHAAILFVSYVSLHFYLPRSMFTAEVSPAILHDSDRERRPLDATVTVRFLITNL